jgi:hypothetical protein
LAEGTHHHIGLGRERLLECGQSRRHAVETSYAANDGTSLIMNDMFGGK